MGCNESTLNQYEESNDGPGPNDFASETNGSGRDGTQENESEHEWSDLPNVTRIKHDITEIFRIDKELGRGGSCRVLRVTKKIDGTEYAMKELLRNDEWNPILFRQEIQVLTTLQHSNILHYCEAYVSDEHFFLCTTLCTGGELFDKVKRLRHFSERMASEVLRVILVAIAHVHSNHIVHRDLKPENIVYDRKGAGARIVLIDFGDAARIPKSSHIFSDFVGTPFYLAPECVRHRAGWELYKSDMWAIGVIAYVLLTGRPPFWGRNNREILQRITQAKIHWPSDVKLSRACRNFIVALLQKDPRRRLSAREALNHVWILQEAAKHDEHLGHKVLKNIAKFSTACKLKKLIVHAIVKDMSEGELETIKEAFKLLDENNDGVVDVGELTRYLINTGLPRDEAQKRAIELIDVMDTDGDRKINLEEFKVGRTASRLTTDTDLIDQQFRRIASKSQNGLETRETITADEIKQSFGELLDEEQLNDIMDEVDQDGDGHISLEEFQKAMKQKTMHIDDLKNLQKKETQSKVVTREELVSHEDKYNALVPPNVGNGMGSSSELMSEISSIDENENSNENEIGSIKSNETKENENENENEREPQNETEKQTANAIEFALVGKKEVSNDSVIDSEEPVIINKKDVQKVVEEVESSSDELDDIVSEVVGSK